MLIGIGVLCESLEVEVGTKAKFKMRKGRFVVRYCLSERRTWEVEGANLDCSQRTMT